MKTITVGSLTILTMLAAGDIAQAGGCNGPACQYPQHMQQQSSGAFHRFFGQQPLPAFQAAPWYLYYPYNGHFQTPAPLPGGYNATPGYGAPYINPYFPGGYGH